ncbi:MAG: Ig-like domain-containing protein [Pseudolysinimonas sp.]
MTRARAIPSRRGALTGLAVLGLVAGSVFALSGPASAAAVPPGSTIDQQNTNGTINCNVGPAVGQTFTAGVSGMLTAVSLNGVTSSVDPSTVDIETTTGGVPTGTILTSASFSSSLNGPLVFATPVHLTAGSVYAIVLESADTVNCTNTNPNTTGAYVYFSGGVWNADGFYDLQFATYMDSSVPLGVAGTAYTSQNVAATVPLTATTTVGPITSYQPEILPLHGTLSITGSTATYTPTTGYFGSDSFAYTATNGNGPSDPRSISVQVGSPASSLSVSTVIAGGQLTVSGSGLPPNVTEQITLNSSPVLLTTVTTSAAGAFSKVVTIPAATVAGSHTITVTGTSGVDPAAAPLTVTAAALAATGTDPGWLVALAAALLALGAVAARAGFAIRRRAAVSG